MDKKLIENANYYIQEDVYSDRHIQESAHDCCDNFLVENISDNEKQKIGTQIKNIEKQLDGIKRKYKSEKFIDDINRILDLTNDWGSVVSGEIKFDYYKKHYLQHGIDMVKSLVNATSDNSLKKELKDVENKIKKI